MTEAVIVNYRECTGCRICEMVCSIRNEGVVSTQLSRIRVYPFPPGLDVPVVCVQCVKTPCIETCPLELLSRDSESGAVVIQEELCNGCGMCTDDILPKRILSEPLPSGIAKGQRLTQAQLDQMLDEYYKLRGWNIQTGAPSKEKLRELELNFVDL